MLDAARRRAGQLGHVGALFPWRTINGEEASAYYAAGTAQYHINAAISYAVRQFERVTGDEEFLVREGVEILVETARFWADLGFFSVRRGGKFCIQGVTGPDEYSAVVDNNAYTNLMAAENLAAAAEALELLRDADPEAHDRLINRLQAGSRRASAVAACGGRHVRPLRRASGVLLQDEHFLNRKPWDFEGTPLDHYPLLLHYHPLNIYRHQVIKQTDVVLATFLTGHRFSLDEKRRVFEYYDPLTTADSSLSSCVQSVMASEVGDAKSAYEYFLLSAAIDLANLAGNTADGVHVASCGGVWMALVNGFARTARPQRRRRPLQAAPAGRLAGDALPPDRPGQPLRGRDDARGDDLPTARRPADRDRQRRHGADADRRRAGELPARSRVLSRTAISGSSPVGRRRAPWQRVSARLPAL